MVSFLVLGMSSRLSEDTHRPLWNAITALQHFRTLPVPLFLWSFINQWHLGKRSTTYDSLTQPGTPISEKYYEFRNPLATSKSIGANASTTSGSCRPVCLGLLRHIIRFYKIRYLDRLEIYPQEARSNMSAPRYSYNFCVYDVLSAEVPGAYRQLVMHTDISYIFLHTNIAVFETTHKEKYVRMEGGFAATFLIL